jgi:hypothetical protein
MRTITGTSLTKKRKSIHQKCVSRISSKQEEESVKSYPPKCRPKKHTINNLTTESSTAKTIGERPRLQCTTVDSISITLLEPLDGSRRRSFGSFWMPDSRVRYSRESSTVQHRTRSSMIDSTPLLDTTRIEFLYSVKYKSNLSQPLIFFLQLHHDHHTPGPNTARAT